MAAPTPNRAALRALTDANAHSVTTLQALSAILTERPSEPFHGFTLEIACISVCRRAANATTEVTRINGLLV